MDRRNALVMLSGMALSTGLLSVTDGALAQTATPKSGMPATLGSLQYRKMTLMAGTFSKQTSQLALTRAGNPKVKEFAGFEAAEQTSIAQVLTDMSNPPPAPLDGPHQQMLQQLTGQSGKAFDTAYVQGQMTGHQELLLIQQKFLDGMPTNRNLEHIAVLARTVINMHLTMLQDLQGMLSS